MSKLFTKIKIGKNTYKNRVVMAPMCTYLVEKKDGVLTDTHYDHYVARALGGVACIIVEATTVNNDKSGISLNDLGLYNEKQKESFKRLVKRVHEYNILIGIQLGHAGIKADKTYEYVLAPSKVKYLDRVVKELSVDEIIKIENDFFNSAKLAKEAGFNFIELHAAHGYLINQFLSPLTNKRNDIYGDSVENRYRFLGNIIRKIKKDIDIDIHIRVSAAEYSEEGNKLDDIINILDMAKKDGVVFISVSSGGVLGIGPSKVYPGYQAHLSKVIKEKDFNCSAVGLLEDFDLSEKLLEENYCDLIYQGRALLKNPNWVYMAAKHFDKMNDIVLPIVSYKR